MTPRAALLTIQLDALRWLLAWLQRVEGWTVRRKLDLIDRIHGEQSLYGW